MMALGNERTKAWVGFFLTFWELTLKRKGERMDGDWNLGSDRRNRLTGTRNDISRENAAWRFSREKNNLNWQRENKKEAEEDCVCGYMYDTGNAPCKTHNTTNSRSVQGNLIYTFKEKKWKILINMLIHGFFERRFS